MAGNRVVAHYRDGRIVKGSTTDFLPTRETMHVHTDVGVEVVQLVELKALFFVRDLEGDPNRQKRNEFDVNSKQHGRRIRVEFADGELLVGTTQGYQPERTGFFVAPADPKANHERVFVLRAATRAVNLL